MFPFFHDFLTGGLEAQPGPGRAFGVADRPAGFAGRAKPAPGPTPAEKLGKCSDGDGNLSHWRAFMLACNVVYMLAHTTL